MLSARVAGLAAAAAAVTAVALLKSLRWWCLYPPALRLPSWWRSFPVLMIAQALNVLIPLRIGEVVRVSLMAQDDIPAGTTLSTIVVEKAVDLVAVGLLVAVALSTTALPLWFPIRSGVQMGVVGIFLFAGLAGLWSARHWFRTWVDRLVKRLRWVPERWQGRLLQLMNDGFEGLVAITDPSMAAPVFLLTTLIWLLSVLTMLFTLAAFETNVGWHAALLLSLALYLGNFVPAPPALIGVIGAVTELTLGWFDVPRTSAAAIGLTLNVLLVGPLVLLGGVAGWIRLTRPRSGK